jgi:hypothetical protein
MNCQRLSVVFFWKSEYPTRADSNIVHKTILIVFHLSSLLNLDCTSSSTLSVEETSLVGEDKSELKLPPCTTELFNI